MEFETPNTKFGHFSTLAAAAGWVAPSDPVEEPMVATRDLSQPQSGRIIRDFSSGLRLARFVQAGIAGQVPSPWPVPPRDAFGRTTSGRGLNAVHGERHAGTDLPP